jgi:Uma2 family endonuclease
MNALPEVVERELTYEELAERYRAMCADPCLENVPGKIELDTWGRMLMNPASNYHGAIQMRLGQRLASLGSEAISEASVLTARGLQVADIAWASAVFLKAHGLETPFTRAPELCVEIASPSNSLRGLREKASAYVAAGATEAWIVFPQSKRIERYALDGAIEQSQFPIDLEGLFDA